jgi:hypothetical protein
MAGVARWAVALRLNLVGTLGSRAAGGEFDSRIMILEKSWIAMAGMLTANRVTANIRGYFFWARNSQVVVVVGFAG